MLKAASDPFLGYESKLHHIYMGSHLPGTMQTERQQGDFRDRSVLAAGAGFTNQTRCRTGGSLDQMQEAVCLPPYLCVSNSIHLPVENCSLLSVCQESGFSTQTAAGLLFSEHLIVRLKNLSLKQHIYTVTKASLPGEQ